MRPLSSPPYPGPHPPGIDALEPGPAQMPAVPAARVLMRWAGMGLVAAIGLYVVEPVLGRPPAARMIPLTRRLAELGHAYAGAAATWAAVGASGVGVLAVLVWSRSWLQWRRSRVRGAIARRLRPVPLRPEQIRVRARWSALRRWLPARIRVRYPAGMVREDPTEALVEMFAVEFGLVVAVGWEPQRDGIFIERIAPPKPVEPDPPRLEERHEPVGKLHTTLAQLLPGLAVDQEQTQMDAAGAPQVLVLRYDQTTKDIAPRFRARVHSVIETKVTSPTGAWAIQWRPEHHTIIVRPSEPLPDRALNTGIPPGHTDPLALALGFGSGGRSVVWQPLKYPHLLVAGVTGAGKTALIRTVLVMALLQGWRVWILDPKQTSFLHFADWPGVERLCITGEEMRQALLDHRDEMQGAYEGLRTGRLTHDQIIPLLLIFDEVTEGFADIVEYVEENFEEIKDGDTNVKLNRELKRGATWRVTRKGREVRAWQLLGLQRPDTRFIPGEARDNLISRAAAGQMRGDGLEMMFEDPAVKQRVTKRVEDPQTGDVREQHVPGRITIDVGNGPEPCQSMWTPDPAKALGEEKELLAQLREMVTDAQTARLRRGTVHQVNASPAAVELPMAESPPLTLEHDPGAAVPQPGPDAGKQVLVGDLEVGQWICLEEDGQTTEVEILDLTADEDDLMATVEYRSADGGEGSYELDTSDVITTTRPPAAEQET